jgi:hypothetical protein
MVNPNEGFWRQLEQYELELKEQRDDDDSDSKNNEEALIPLDASWALHSNAVFVTCREIPEALNQERSWRRLGSLSKSLEQLDKLLFVCLDFVWGRGVSDVDIDWLIHVCRQMISLLVESSSLSSSSSFQQRLKVVLQDPESEFSQIWSGEIYSKDIDRILQATSKLLKDNRKET